MHLAKPGWGGGVFSRTDSWFLQKFGLASGFDPDFSFDAGPPTPTRHCPLPKTGTGFEHVAEVCSRSMMPPSPIECVLQCTHQPPQMLTRAPDQLQLPPPIQDGHDTLLQELLHLENEPQSTTPSTFPVNSREKANNFNPFFAPGTGWKQQMCQEQTAILIKELEMCLHNDSGIAPPLESPRRVKRGVKRPHVECRRTVSQLALKVKEVAPSAHSHPHGKDILKIVIVDTSIINCERARLEFSACTPANINAHVKVLACLSKALPFVEQYQPHMVFFCTLGHTAAETAAFCGPFRSCLPSNSAVIEMNGRAAAKSGRQKSPDSAAHLRFSFDGVIMKPFKRSQFQKVIIQNLPSRMLRPPREYSKQQSPSSKQPDNSMVGIFTSRPKLSFRCTTKIPCWRIRLVQKHVPLLYIQPRSQHRSLEPALNARTNVISSPPTPLPFMPSLPAC